MNKVEYKIKVNNLTNKSEETSSVATISYEIENANNNVLPKEKIMEQINGLKGNGKFPSNLEYVDSYTDLMTGTTSAAFLNKDTEKITVGMTGTNVHVAPVLKTFLLTNLVSDRQDMIDTLGSLQDIGADANIGLNTVTDKDRHFKNTQQFIKNIKKNYDIDTITGHSLGGRDAIIIGISNDIDNVVVYNPAPLTIKDFRRVIKSPGNNFIDEEKDAYIESLIKKYDGNILRIVSEKDELNGFVKSMHYVSAGNERVIKNGKKHSMVGFLGKREQCEIKAELEKLKGYTDANNKSFMFAKK